MKPKSPSNPKGKEGHLVSAWQRRGKPEIPAPPIPADPETVIGKAQAISLISDKVAKKFENTREVRNKVAGRVRTAIANGQLVLHGDGFVFGDLVAWAQGKKVWTKALASLSRFYSSKPDNRIQVRASSDHIFLPGNIDACHTALQAAHNRIRELEKALLDATEQLAAQKPIVEKFHKLQRDGKKAAAKQRNM